jgi:pre-rRNA-processing protein IPI3
MLTEQFIASIGVPSKAPGTHIAKDAGIFIHEFQPLQAQRAIFKKSATPPNSLAISNTHIFAVQAEKSVVHVYSREHGNQEATVPFTERITSLTLACDGMVLILGTTEGRLFLWETSSGRQVSTSQAHLQAVNKVVVDPTQNFILSASEDATVHIWPLPAILSFTSSGIQAPTPIQTFSSHRAAINALVVGHSSSFCNFAVSASKDKTCFVWDYHTGHVLRTYLLPEVPTSLALDAADRAIYAGYEYGSVQRLDLYSFSTPSKSIHGGSTDAPIQPAFSSRWNSPDKDIGAVRSLSLSFDSCTLLSGHESGQIVSWDVAKGGFFSNILQHALPGPVNNIEFLPVTGVSEVASQAGIQISSVVKPKFGAFDSASGTVPGSYVQSVELSGALVHGKSTFDDDLQAPSFAKSTLDDGLRELYEFRQKPQTNGSTSEYEAVDFMALDTGDQQHQLSLEQQNINLKAELEALRRLQAASFEKMDRIVSEKRALEDREQKRLKAVSMSGNPAINGTYDSSSSED